MARYSILMLMFCATGFVNAQETPRPPYVIDEKTKQVTRKDDKGKALWTVTMDCEIGGHRPPHILWDTKRVYVTHKDGVTALDAENGIVLWHFEGPDRGLMLSDDLLLGISCVQNKDGKESSWLYACDIQKGTITFKSLIAVGMCDPRAVEQIGKLFMVQNREAGFKMRTYLFDRKGNIQKEIDREVVCGQQIGEDMVYLTGKDVFRITPNNKVVWTLPFDRNQFVPGGQLVDLGDGDIIASMYGCISDSGVSLIRMDAVTGKVKWKHHCNGYGANHSKYSHSAMIKVEKDQLHVMSKGPGCSFLEKVDLKTGKQLDRTEK